MGTGFVGFTTATAGCFAASAERWREFASMRAGDWEMACKAMSYAARHDRAARQLSVEGQ